MTIQSETVTTNGEVQFVTLYTRIVRTLTAHPRIAQETLSRSLDVTMRTVQRHLTALEREGYITVNRDRKPYVYAVVEAKPVPHMEWSVGIPLPKSAVAARR